MQTEFHNFKTLFYQSVPRDAVEFIRKFINENKLQKHFNEAILIRWIDVLFRADHNIPNATNRIVSRLSRQEINCEDFYEYCETNSSETVVKLLTKILKDNFYGFNFKNVVRYIDRLVIKKKYNSSHFKQPLYIKTIIQDIQMIVNQIGSGSYYIDEDGLIVFKEIDEKYYWSSNYDHFHMREKDDSGFVSTQGFSLIRKYDPDHDSKVLEDMKIAKRCYSFDVYDDEIMMFAELPKSEEEREHILDFMVYFYLHYNSINIKLPFEGHDFRTMTDQIQQTTASTLPVSSLSFDFSFVSDSTYDFLKELYTRLGLKIPLKFFKKQSELMDQLEQHLDDSCIVFDSTKKNKQIVMCLSRSSILKLLNYTNCDMLYEQLVKIQNPFTLPGNFIWEEMIDRYKIANRYGFEPTLYHFEEFRKNYVNDYQLKQLVSDIGIEETIDLLIRSIVQTFKIHDEKTVYLLDLFPYIKKLIDASNIDYQLPKDAWSILTHYFSKHRKLDFDDYDDLLFSSISENDKAAITQKLIESIEQHYHDSVSTISYEMRSLNNPIA